MTRSPAFSSVLRLQVLTPFQTACIVQLVTDQVRYFFAVMTYP